jgi:hypothetical protein
MSSDLHLNSTARNLVSVSGLDTARTLGFGRLAKASPQPHHASSGSSQQHRARGSSSSELECFVLADWTQGLAMPTIESQTTENSGGPDGQRPGKK